MKRLLKVSLDTVIISVIPIISWILLGLIVDKNLINIFTLTYPFQYLCALLKSIFGVGPNVYKEKNNSYNDVMSGITLGIIIGIIIFGIFAIEIDSYINFMNMDVNIYHYFAIYSVMQICFQLILSLVLEKLYYEGKNSLANKYTLTYNTLNLVVLLGTALIWHNQVIIIVSTLIITATYLIYIVIKEADKFKLNCRLFKWISCDSIDCCDNLFYFLIYLFGISTAASFGPEYIAAMNFVTIITDTQWDAIEAISTVAKIDIAKGKFNYKEHRHNAFTLLNILIISVLIMFAILFPFYEVGLVLTLIYLGVDIFNFYMYPIRRIKACYLNLEYSSGIITTNKVIASGSRTLLSFLPTPFCCAIGQVISTIYQFITVNFIFKSHYKINRDGNVIKK